MNKVFFSGFLAIAATATTGCGARSAPQEAPMANKNQKPNIIFVLADDMGYADLPLYGGQGVKTPNVDKLAAQGIRFTQFYVNSPICSPSRTAFMTGQYPARWNITSYIDNRELNQKRGMAQWLDLSAPTVARSLSNAGYECGHFGKWHMGGGRDVGEAPLPTEYGFASSLTQFEGLGPRVLPMMSAQDGKPAFKMGLGAASEKLGRGEVKWVPRADVTSAFVDGALGFMEQAQKDGKPFYLNLWPDDVHSPFDPPQSQRGDGSKRELYRGVVSNMDKELGPLFDAVANDPKLRDNTLIIFASDNGPEQGAGLAGPFRGSKGQLYEGGIREPLIVWGPGLVPAAKAGTVNETAIVSGVDFLPSLLKIAGANEIPKGDGADLSATLMGKTAAGRVQPLFWKRPPDRPGSPEEPLPDFAVRDGNMKLLVQADGSRPQLYDLSKDKGETNNLAAAQPQMVQRLTKAVMDWNKTLPVVKLPAEPKFNTATHFDLKMGASLDRFAAPNVAEHGIRISAKFDTAATATGGVIVAQGGVAVGYTLFLDKESKLHFLVRVDRKAASIASTQPLKGAHNVIARLGADRSLTLSVDGKVVAQGTAPKLLDSQPLDGLSVGADSDGPVGPYQAPFAFQGKIEAITIDLESPFD